MLDLEQLQTLMGRAIGTTAGDRLQLITEATSLATSLTAADLRLRGDAPSTINPDLTQWAARVLNITLLDGNLEPVPQLFRGCFSAIELGKDGTILHAAQLATPDSYVYPQYGRDGRLADLLWVALIKAFQEHILRRAHHTGGNLDDTNGTWFERLYRDNGQPDLRAFTGSAFAPARGLRPAAAFGVSGAELTDEGFRWLAGFDRNYLPLDERADKQAGLADMIFAWLLAQCHGIDADDLPDELQLPGFARQVRRFD